MGIFIDLLIIAIILLNVWLSAKRGFVRTAIEIAGFFLAIIISIAVSKPVAAIIYDKGVEPGFVSSVSTVPENDVGSAVDSFLNKVPAFIKNNVDSEKISSKALTDKFTHESENGLKSAAKSVSEAVIKPVFVNIVGFAISAVMFIILMLAVKFLAKILNGVFSFSIIGKLNSALGGAAGLLKGAIVALAFCMIVKTVVSFTDNGFLIFTKENISNAKIFKLLTSFFN